MIMFNSYVKLPEGSKFDDTMFRARPSLRLRVLLVCLWAVSYDLSRGNRADVARQLNPKILDIVRIG